MPAGHRRVGREHRAGADRLERLVEGRGPVLGELADALEAEEAGVALVGVEHLGLGWPVSAQYARIARTPPMPSSISCSSRWSVPPP